MKVAYAFLPFPANFKQACNATLPATPPWTFGATGNPFMTTSSPYQPTVKVNGTLYTIVRMLGEGLHSRVYAAIDSRTSVPVAIKVVSNIDPVDNGEHSQMFFKEIRYLTKLQPRNPYVIRVFNHDFDLRTQTGKIVMETGQDFRFMLPLHSSPEEVRIEYKFFKRMTDSQAKYYWYQMVDAVKHLHQNGIIHSDIKPENFIMVDQGQLRIIDLGLSFRLPQTQTSALRPFAGTPEYMPPEVCRIQKGQYSRYGKPADIWALGILLFEMVFGYRPFEHIQDNFEKMTHIANMAQNIHIPPTNNPHLADILQRCLQMNPLRRPTAEQILQHQFLNS
ncbi:unnamed protein product [Didymodactylos carnosus]|uniref:Protein kinase domain-containing protein n=1 Tax=Didymodactylos carnosus TaxID=1234261 RepID=A0A8S2F355_9BILA|nr:unnamed protein product [Didymodactylos carnosus]CAF4120622.1 unnamed protein product [Didymodactylos carnosus]